MAFTATSSGVGSSTEMGGAAGMEDGNNDDEDAPTEPASSRELAGTKPGRVKRRTLPSAAPVARYLPPTAMERCDAQLAREFAHWAQSDLGGIHKALPRKNRR